MTMVGGGYSLRNGNGTQGYRKRGTFTTNTKKKFDPQKELDEDLLALDTVDAESCWKIYRLEEGACDMHIPPQPKQKNCRQNPYCIHRLGLEKFDKLQQSQKGGTAAETLVRRNPNTQPCGLVNYGNFCYVNSFLQIWFNDLRFRQCVYDWRSHPDWVKPVEAKLDIQEVMNCLQRLFLTLQFTPFETTDARDFIQLLRLDNEQQDVQEFHTLFFDTIERNLEVHPNGEPIRTAIRQLFQSRIKQNTICYHCNHASEASSEYRSLPISIDGFNSLSAALDKFFQPENLTDYKCNQCKRTGETDKFMGYAVLPQVLIIQLNRYVYDSSKERHKKLKTAIPYSRILKANKLKEDAAYADEYELCAVMIHEGPNTHCGHYYDIIRDPLTKYWFTYNDKHVQMEKRAPGFEGNKEPKEITRASSDQKGCYALIYQRKPLRTDEGGGADGEVQLRLPQEEVVKEVCSKLEDEFTRQSKEGNRSKRLWEYRITQRHTYLSTLVRELEVKGGALLMDQPGEIAFIPTSLLSELFAKEYEAVLDMRNLDMFNLDLQQLIATPQKQTKLEVVAETPDKENRQQNGHRLLSRREGGSGGGGTGQQQHPPLARDDSNLSFDAVDPNYGKQPSGSGPGQQQEKDTSFDYTAYEHIYAPEPLRDVHFVLCQHGKVPLDSVTKGELKAVRTTSAQRLISDFNIRWLVHQADWQKSKSQDDQAEIANSGEPSTSAAAADGKDGNGDMAMAAENVEKMDIHSSSNHCPSVEEAMKANSWNTGSSSPFADNSLKTGEDLCVECVKILKNEACYRNNLVETDRMLTEPMRNLAKRTHDPNRDNPDPTLSPPENAVWVSVDHLRRFKKIALAQMEKAGRLSMQEIEEPAEKRPKGESDDGNDHEDAMAALTGYPPQSKNDDDILIVEEHISSQGNITQRKRRTSEGSFLSADDIDASGEAEGSKETNGEANVTKFHEDQSEVNGTENETLDDQQQREGGRRSWERNGDGVRGGDGGIEVLAEEEEQKVIKFNEELYCRHGNLSCKPKRVWLTKEEWSRLKMSFIDCCDPIPCTTLECPECIEEFNNMNVVREINFNQLQQLYNDIRALVSKFATRRSWNNLELGNIYTHVICRNFVNKMRTVTTRSRAKSVVEIPRICQECLLCNHGRPYLPWPEQMDEDSSGLNLFGNSTRRKEPQHAEGIPVRDSEWIELLKAYEKHVPEHTPPPPIILQDNGHFPDFCDECYIQHNQMETLKSYIYPEGANIFVKLKGDESEDLMQAKAAEASTSSRTGTMTTRRGAQKNLYIIKMRSDQRVMDLKVELMKKTNQSPNDQLLYLGDEVLDSNLTLEAAQVAANNRDNPLILILQQRMDSDTEPSGSGGGAPRALEKGFKDTALSA